MIASKSIQIMENDWTSLVCFDALSQVAKPHHPPASFFCAYRGNRSKKFRGVWRWYAFKWHMFQTTKLSLIVSYSLIFACLPHVLEMALTCFFQMVGCNLRPVKRWRSFKVLWISRYIRGWDGSFEVWNLNLQWRCFVENSHCSPSCAHQDTMDLDMANVMPRMKKNLPPTFWKKNHLCPTYR